MKTIVISGVIGYDVSPSDIRKALGEAKGEALDVQISSPGGFVTDGLEIYNLIKGYKGKKTTHLMGLAASMASYIALAGDKVTAEPNAVFMIHNALGGAMGNHNDLRKAADIFEGFSQMLAIAYSAKTGKPSDEIRALMDAETFYFGAEGKDAGFIDEMLGEPTDDKAASVSTAKAARAACDEIIRQYTDEDTLPRLAAMIPVSAITKEPRPAADVAVKSLCKEVVMDDHELLRAEYDKGVQAGIAMERNRRNELAAFRGVNPDGDRAVEEAIASDKATANAMPTIMAAIAKGKSPAADGENAPAITAATPATGSGVLAITGMTAEDIAALRAAGLTDAEIKANAPKGKE